MVDRSEIFGYDNLPRIGSESSGLVKVNFERERRADSTVTLRNGIQTTDKTFVILGTGRGGTSAAALALACLGVPLAERIDPDSLDDRDFAEDHAGDVNFFNLEQNVTKFVSAIGRVVKYRNKIAPVWAVKEPLLPFYFSSIKHLLRSPHLIIITRDITAIAHRATISSVAQENEDFVQYFDHALKSYGKIHEIILDSENFPVLCVSYEKLLLNTRQVIFDLAAFAGANVTELGLATALGSIRPDRRSAQIDLGRIDMRGHGNPKLPGLFRYEVKESLSSPPPSTEIPSTQGEAVRLVSKTLDSLNRNSYAIAMSLADVVEKYLIFAGAGSDIDKYTSSEIDRQCKEMNTIDLECAFAIYYVRGVDSEYRSQFSKALKFYAICSSIARYVVSVRGYVSGCCYNGYWQTVFRQGRCSIHLGRIDIALEQYSLIDLASRNLETLADRFGFSGNLTELKEIFQALLGDLNFLGISS